MKIQEFVTRITKAEGGKQQVNVAQVSEVFKLINGSLWGIPYGLVWFKKNRFAQILLTVALVMFGLALTVTMSGCAHVPPVAAPGCAIARAEITAVEAGDTRPASNASKNNFALGGRNKRHPNAVDTIFGV